MATHCGTKTDRCVAEHLKENRNTNAYFKHKTGKNRCDKEEGKENRADVPSLVIKTNDEGE